MEQKIRVILSDDYERHGNDPRWWILKSNETIIAAEILEKAYSVAEEKSKRQPSGVASVVPDAMRTRSVTIFLKAVTIELLLKALILGRGGKFIVNDKFVLPEKHDLYQLAQRAQFHITDREKILLDKLTDGINAWGRYPTPTNKKHWRKKTPEGEGFIYVWSSTDNELVSRLLGRLHSDIATFRFFT